MPKGYTADIKDGISFDEYAMNCARAFGTLILMRDDPKNSPIPEKIEPSDYHLNKINEAKDELKSLEAMTISEANKQSLIDWEKSEEYRLRRLAENKELRVKYNEMLKNVNSWSPPTKDHEGLHEFMREQIESSINFDCDEEFYRTPDDKASGEEWLLDKKEAALKNISYHTKENEEEIKRTDERNSWINSLRDSLNN